LFFFYFVTVSICFLLNFTDQKLVLTFDCWRKFNWWNFRWSEVGYL